MKIKDVSFSNIPQFSSFDKDYVENHELFADFYNRPPLPSSFPNQLEEKKSNYTFDRGVLSQVIEDQYLSIGLLDHERRGKIEQIKKPNCFTVITAHQPSLLTGPFYFIHKIVSVITTASYLNDQLEDGLVVPVFIIGGEDHDFEEINHFHFNEHTFRWKNGSGGAVGRMSTKGVHKVLEELQPHLEKSFYGKEILDLLKHAYGSDKTLSEATQYFIAELFKHSPLIVVSMDNRQLKKAFIPYIERELFDQISHPLVNSSQEALKELGYEPQAYAREINFFYLHDHQRSRIIKQKDRFLILDTELSFDEAELRQEIGQNPERFSPNVIMRPIYQEFIFPNLAYIGGGGELAYWMERKKQFQAFDLTFPILLRRHSATLIQSRTARKAGSFDWKWEDWFLDKDELIRKFIASHHADQLDFKDYHGQLHDLFDKLTEHMSKVDQSLEYSSEAARADALKVLDRLRKKLYRALKDQEEVQLQRLETVRQDMLPSGSLQERRQNFISYYEKTGPRLLEALEEAFIPFDIQMKLLIDP